MGSPQTSTHSSIIRISHFVNESSVFSWCAGLVLARAAMSARSFLPALHAVSSVSAMVTGIRFIAVLSLISVG
jgi:hypothetical protein